MRLRLRLTLVFAVVMAAVLGGVGWWAYGRIADGFSADLNRELSQRAQDISGPLGRPGITLGDLAGRGFIERGESFAELLTPSGRVVEATATLRGRPLLTPAEATTASRRTTTLDVPTAPGLNERARLLAAPFRGADGRDLVLVVGATRENGFEALDEIRGRMLVAGPALLLVSSLLAYLLAAAALRPVERMRRQAAAMEAGTGHRLRVPGPNDEVRRLAETLNDLLSRVDDGVERERRFLANASHELRTPLALLRTELDLARRRDRSHEELLDAVHSASGEVDRLVRLANDLLALSRDEGDGPHVLRAPVDLPALLTSYVSQRGPAVHVGSCDAGVVELDETRLRQVLDNLVDNALGHGARAVTLSAVDVDGCVEVHAVDDGPGFPGDLLPHAFDRFARAPGSHGAGLGLAIVAAVARAHGGSAGAANRADGGADVWVRLPRHPDRRGGSLVTEAG